MQGEKGRILARGLSSRVAEENSTFGRVILVSRFYMWFRRPTARLRKQYTAMDRNPDISDVGALFKAD